MPGARITFRSMIDSRRLVRGSSEQGDDGQRERAIEHAGNRRRSMAGHGERLGILVLCSPDTPQRFVTWTGNHAPPRHAVARVHRKKMTLRQLTPAPVNN